MSRLFLLLALGVVTWLYFPESRTLVMDVVQPVALPVLRWSTEEEMATVGRNAVDQERLTGHLPAGPEWLKWLDDRYPYDASRRDPWGSTYQLEVSRDTVWTLSSGPARVRGTPDDFRIATPRDL